MPTCSTPGPGEVRVRLAVAGICNSDWHMVQSELRRDFPRILALYLAGKFKLDELISQRYRLDQINEANANLLTGDARHGVIVFDGA